MTLKQRERLLVLATILCLVLLLGDRLVLSPLVSVWQKRGARIVQLKAFLAEGRSLQDREDVLKDTWKDMNRRSLPLKVSEAENEIFQAVGRWVERSRLEITSLTPRWSQGEVDFRVLEFRATGQGNLNAIARFLYELESDPLPLKVEEIDLAARGERGETLSLSVRFSGLMPVAEEKAAL